MKEELAQIEEPIFQILNNLYKNVRFDVSLMPNVVDKKTYIERIFMNRIQEITSKWKGEVR